MLTVIVRRCSHSVFFLFCVKISHIFDKFIIMSDKKITHSGEGIRPTQTTNIFKAINAEINSTQNKVLVGLGLVAAAGVFGYITYVRHRYERLGYYMALREDGRTEFIKKKSNWEL